MTVQDYKSSEQARFGINFNTFTIMNGNQPTDTPAPDTMTVNIPQELQEQVAQWQDGGSYQCTLTQTGEGQFDLASIEGENAEQPGPTNDTTPERTNPGSMNDIGGTTIPSKNPAVANLIMSRRSGK